MLKTAIILSVALLPHAICGKLDYGSQSSPGVLLTLRELRMDISSAHGITANTCMSVWPDGQFHLEVRVQQLPNKYATVRIYEGLLNGFQLQRVITVLNSQSVKDIAPFRTPNLPFDNVVTFAHFYAEIAREDQVQKVGYFLWDPKPGDFVQSISASQKDQWQKDQTTLVPLVQWFHEIEGMKWSELPVDASTLCSY
jgi:hypothetical protein